MSNFRFDDDFSLPKGDRARITSNIRAIELLKTLEREGRQASADEQNVLSKYVGWGGLPQVFNSQPDSRWISLAENLQDLLESEEYDAAFESTLNAHYTSGVVIQQIYQGLEHLGFSGGSILEPSMGVGNFLGHMPEPLAMRSEVTGIELDPITGRIAKQLYPEHKIHVKGFQETPLPRDYFDLAISNVPFGDYPIADPEYDPLNLRIHNYFFARSIDRIRPGGLIAFVTSTGTMQSQSGKAFRAWLSERSNLVVAMRLPGDAFKEVAGTEVTTDLIVLQKLGKDIPSYEQNWIELAETSIQDAEGNYLKTNEYYVSHPDMMLGELADDTLFPGRLALKSDGRDLSEAMKQAFDAMPSNIYRHQISLSSAPELESLRVKLPPEAEVKPFGYLAQGDVLWQRQGDWLYPANLKGKTTERVIGMLKVRDAVQQVFDVQLNHGTDQDLRVAQQKLNQVYDVFVRENGNLTDSANVRAFQADPDAQLLSALERINPDTKEIAKADVFFQRTVRPRIIKSEASSAQEALLASLNEYGEVVPGYMAQLLGQEETEVLDSLQSQNLVFQDPVSQRWLTEDDYLSGDVRRKLAIAQNAISEHPQYQINVDALRSVQPRDLEPGEIEVRLGASWLPKEVIADFAYDLLEVSPEDHQIKIAHNAEYAVWSVQYPYSLDENAQNCSVHGTKYISALELLEQSLNLKDATVYYRTPEGAYKVDTEPTLAARLKQQIMQDRFKSWIWQDFDRAEKLCQIYNELYNGSIVREFRNPNLEMPGSSPEIELRPHQKDAVWRILQSKSTLLGHVVGAGKTYTMIAGALEMRRLNIAQKPMVVVPNHMLGQFTRELYQLYPNAKVLAPTEKETQKSNRKQLMARIATGDWDAVIVTHSAFTRLPVSKAEQMKYLQGQLAELNRLMGDSDVKRGNGVVKQLARERQRLKERVAKITNSTSKDDGVSFEQLGVDALFVDEAHFWKNLSRQSKLKNIAGLSNTSSQRAMDAFIKTRIVERNGGRLVFATGTPISNSIAEMYTMQRFLQPETLKAKKISSFDSWVGNFAEKVTAPEIDPTGRFKTKTRLARFTNVPELMAIFRDVADIRTAKQLNLPRPEAERLTIAAQASSLQLSYMERLIDRAESIQAKKVQPDEDNMLWVTTDGRRAALEPRLIAPNLPDYPDSKVNQAIANIHAIWQATDEQRLTQMVFCDLGTPKKAKEGEKPPFSIYQHIKTGLVNRGIPAEDVAFIHDAKTSKEKERLYSKIREGKTRILIGSTEKCGVGMNIQTRLFAEHHLDPPWRPSDIEQREGRILRQGNFNSKIMLLTYVTQGRDGQLGFDSYSWQTLARKAEMVAQVMDGDTAVRSVDDITSQALSFDEVKAIATGNPLIIEKADVDNRVTELSRFKQAFINERHTAQRQIHYLPNNIENHKNNIARYKEDISRRQPTKGDAFQLKVGSRVYTKRKEAGGVLLNYLMKAQVSGKTGTQSIGSYGGFELIAHTAGKNQFLELKSTGGTSYAVKIRDTPMALVNSLDAALDSIDEELKYTEQALVRDEASLSTLSQNLDKPFEYEDELQSLLERQLEINQELGLNKNNEQQVVAEESEESPEQETKVEETQELVDLDSLSPQDQEWEWDEVDWDADIPCKASPEVLALLSQITLASNVQQTLEAQSIPDIGTEQSELVSDKEPEISAQQDIQISSNSLDITEAITEQAPPISKATPENTEAIASADDSPEQAPAIATPEDAIEQQPEEPLQTPAIAEESVQPPEQSTQQEVAKQLGLDFGQPPKQDLAQSINEKLEQGDLPGALDDSIQFADESKAIAQDAVQSLQAKREAIQDKVQQTLEKHPVLGEEKPQSTAENTAIADQKAILPPQQQGSQAAKNISQLLRNAGIESAVLAGDDFHLRAEQPNFRPFVVERHNDQLYLTHYNTMNGDTFIDAEMVFQIGDRGNLSLQETASFNSFTGGELRNKDHGFAAQFSSNLLDQNWAIALSKAREDLKQEQEASQQLAAQDKSPVIEETRSPQVQAQTEEGRSPELAGVENPSKNVSISPDNWARVAQAIGRPEADIDRINQIKDKPLNEQAKSVMQKDFTKHSEQLNDLRTWYRAAVEIEKPQLYLDGIQAIAEDFKNGTSIAAEVRSVIGQDLHEGAYKKLEAGLDLTTGEQVLQEVAKRGLEMGMPPKYVQKILLQGNQGLRDTHKVQPRQTEKYVAQVIGKAIQRLPEQLRGQVMKQVKASQVNNQKQKQGGISR